jgi:hypothetical protein
VEVAGVTGRHGRNMDWNFLLAEIALLRDLYLWRFG